MGGYTKLRGEERRDFLQSKYEYYRVFNMCVVVFASLASTTYFISDCQLFERFAWETLLPRMFILIPLVLFLAVYSKCNDYRIMSVLSQLMAHAIMWCTIWAIYFLPIKTHASEGFIIMHLVFLTVAYCSPFAYSSISHLCVLANILISNLFNHYENLDIMLSLGIPCILAIIATNFVMSEVYYDTYLTKKKLEEALVRDPLTMAFNRNKIDYITQNGRFCFKGAEKANVLMVDVDWFKNVNDTYGHDQGDLVLQTIAEIIRKNISEESMVIRWGGEEFVVILPNTSVKEAAGTAEVIRRKVEECEMAKCRITISVGVAPCDLSPYAEVVTNADKALYIAKQTGKNRVICYEG